MGDWPTDTIAAVFQRDTPDGAWRLFSLYRGDAARSDNYDCGWNSKADANLYALTGSGPGRPHLHRLVVPYLETSAVWSSVGWQTHRGTIADGTYVIVDADPFALGYQVLDALPDIRLMEVDQLLFCETCDEEQDVDYLCGHIWWCDTDPGWRGAVDDGQSAPCSDGDCYECAQRAPTAAPSAPLPPPDAS